MTHLPTEDETPVPGELLLYTSPDGNIRLDLRIHDETLWMTQQMMAELFQTSKQNIGQHIANILQEISMSLQPGQPLYELLYAIAIIFFSFFYTALVFNPRETADNLKKSGAFIPGIRPGEQTARFIDKVMTRLTLAGALYITAICLVPQLLMTFWHVQFYFGGTSLLIIVVVIMDFMAQVQTHMMSHQYGDVLRKANLKGVGR